jgi:SAM-dependent methyltransferase
VDVVLHLRDRASLFAEVARVLAPGGRFLLTDAGVQTGTVLSEEIALRSLHGPTRVVPPAFNPEALNRAGLAVLREDDLTPALIRSATGRRQARQAHRVELIAREGSAGYERQDAYLETVILLAERGALSRKMYLALVPA